MDDRSGDLYLSKEEALKAGVPERHIVEMVGTEKAIKRISRRVRMVARNEHAKRKARRKAEKRSRRGNR